MLKFSLPYKPTHLLIPAIALLAAIFSGLSYFGLLPFWHLPAGNFSHAPVSVTTASVSQMAKPIEIPMKGSVESRKAAIVGAQISGRISKVSVTDGQMVEAGQELVGIQGTSPIVTAPANSQAAGKTMTDEPASQTAQDNYDNLLKEYERYQKLYQLGAVPRRQVEDLEAKLTAAREALEAPSENNIPFAAPSASATPQEVVATITAPIAGKITEITAANEASVQTGQQLMVIDTGGDIRVVVHAAQEDLYLIQSGTKAIITADGTPNQTLIGQVESISPEIGADTSSFRTHIRVDNTNGLLKPGQEVNVNFLMEQTIPVSVIPKKAVIEEKGLSYIFLAIDGKAVRQEVTTGAIINDFLEITSDLPEQAVIITSGLDKLKDGDELLLP